MSDMPENINAGHRERAKLKFLKNMNGSVEDYELLELMLMYAIPRKDVKPLAKTLLARFKSLGAVLCTSAEELQQVDGIKQNTAILLKVISQATNSILKREVLDNPILSNWETIENYCYALLGRESKENVYLVLLDASNRVIDTVQVHKGTVDKASIYVREIVEILLKNHAISFIMVHNHPSGDTRPSRDDILITHTLQQATHKIGIRMQDHYIISPKGVNSFRLMDLMLKDLK